MIKRVIFTTEENHDIAQAYQWYEECEHGLGEEFLRCIEACTESIQRNPLMYRIAVDAFRHALVRRFPFEVFYELSQEHIVIYSVFHSAQDPSKWHRRLGHN